MKKIKWTIMALVILLSVGGAFATRPKLMSPQEYFWNGVTYQQTAGSYGIGFYCIANPALTCTYINNFGNYIPYRAGTYALFPEGVQQSKNTKGTQK